MKHIVSLSGGLAKVGQDQMSMFDGVAEDSYGCFCAY